MHDSPNLTGTDLGEKSMYFILFPHITDSL